jgi:ActR/RegA family two-component response regulator
MNGKSSLLLVDDDSTVSWALGRFLTRRGFAVTACGDGAEALDLLRSQSFDALVTDIQLPGVNGLALIEWARTERPDMRVVVMTAFGSESIRAVALRKGAILYAEKPVDPELVCEMLTSPFGRDTFSGSVSDINLFDYIQLMLITNRKVVLDVTENSGRTGTLFIEQGRVVHACCGDLEGEPAFFRCLGFEGGSFNTLPWRQPERQTIDKTGEFLLIDAARLKDEAGRSDIPAPNLAFSTDPLTDLDDFDLDLGKSVLKGTQE